MSFFPPSPSTRKDQHAAGVDLRDFIGLTVFVFKSAQYSLDIYSTDFSDDRAPLSVHIHSCPGVGVDRLSRPR